MSFHPSHGVYHRMPVFFGPAPGPRQAPPGVPPFDYSDTRIQTLGTRFLTNADQLKEWLPDGFELWGDPIVTVDVTYFKRLPWLAGRGYNLSDVKCEVIFRSRTGPIHGTMVFVRYENLADPILSGREELGHNKLYCEIPEFRVHSGKYSVTLGWLDSPFMTLECWDFGEVEELAPPPIEHKGQLSYKYMPRTGEWGVPETQYVTLSPNLVGPGPSPIRSMGGRAGVRWAEPLWENLPTLYHVVAACRELEQLENLGGFYTERIGGFDGATTIALD